MLRIATFLFLGIVATCFGQAQAEEGGVGWDLVTHHDLGYVDPEEAVVGHSAVQLFVVASGPYEIHALTAQQFYDLADGARSISVERLQWRLPGAQPYWTPFSAAGRTVLYTAEGTTGEHETVYAVDYRFTPTWDDIPALGGYALDVAYQIIGEARLYASLASPNPVALGEEIRFTCSRSSLKDETFTFELQATGVAGLIASWHERSGTSTVAYSWTTATESVAPGEYTYYIRGEQSGLCGVGRVTLTHNPSPPLMSFSLPEALPPPEMNALILSLSVEPHAAIGEWVAGTIRLTNTSDTTAHDLQVTLTLPLGLEPIAGADELLNMTITTLAPRTEWVGHVMLLVTPKARPGIITAHATGTLDLHTPLQVSAYGEATFAPHADAWTQPQSRLVGSVDVQQPTRLVVDGLQAQSTALAPTYRIAINRGWHTLWAALETGERSQPWLVAVETGAPVRHDLEALPFVGQDLGSLVGFVSVGASREAWHTSWLGDVRSRHGAWSLQSRVGHSLDGAPDSWEVGLAGPRGIALRASETMDAAGNPSQRLQVSWTPPRKPTDPGRIRLGLSLEPGTSPVTEVAWAHANDAGGVSVSHLSGASLRDSMRLAVWRGPSGEGPAFRIESETDGERGAVRVGLMQAFRTPIGDFQAWTRWNLGQAADNWGAHVAWEARRGGAHAGASQPFGRLSLSARAIDMRFGWKSTSPGGVGEFSLGHRVGQGDFSLRWYRRQIDTDLALDVAISRGQQGQTGSVRLTDLPVGAAKLDLQVEVVSGSGVSSTDFRILGGSEIDTWQWSVARVAQSQNVETRHRLDHLRLLTGNHRVGILAGTRHVEATGDTRDHRTMTAFIGGWGEVKLFPDVWGGVGGAKWNSGGGNEYHIYLRYELTQALWIQAGYHASPGVMGVLGPMPTGSYARLMWAFHTGW